MQSQPSRPPNRPYLTAFIAAAIYIAIVSAAINYFQPPRATAFAAGEMAGRLAMGPALLAALITGFWASRVRARWSRLRIGVTTALISIAILLFNFATWLALHSQHGTGSG